MSGRPLYLSAKSAISLTVIFLLFGRVSAQFSQQAFLLDDELKNNNVDNKFDFSSNNNNNDKYHWNSSYRGIHSTIKAQLFERPTVLGATTTEEDRNEFVNYRRLPGPTRRQHDVEETAASAAGGGGNFDAFVRLGGDEKADVPSPRKRHREPVDYLRSTRGGFVPAGGPYPNSIGPSGGGGLYPTPYGPASGGNGYVGSGGFGRIPNSGRMPQPEYGGCPMSGLRGAGGCGPAGCGGCGCGCPTTAPLLPSLPPPQPLLPPAPLFPPPPPACACPPPAVCPPPTVCPLPPLPLPCPKPLPPLSCPQPLPPAPCICPPTAPLLPPPQPLLPPAWPQPRCPLPPAYIPQNDCCCNCQRPCRNIRLRRYSPSYSEKSRRPPAADPKCNSDQLLQIIAKNISEDLESAKRRIQAVAEREMGRAFNTICGASEFSFIVHAKLYCQATVDNTTCYAFSFT